MKKKCIGVFLFRYHDITVIIVLKQLEYTRRVIRIRISKKNRQHNGQKEQE
jgi:hypothetical protein